MKFANYHYIGKNINNLGDHVQVLTVDYLYHQMGIPKEEIVYIDKDDLATYDGEPVVLPVSMPLIDYKEHGIAGMFSKQITPVFLGLTLAKDILSDEEVEYYKKHEPVGCRDERTYNTLCGYGINAYLGGCMTVILPRREQNAEKQKKIFIIDPTQGIKTYLPEEIRKNAVRDTHLFYGAMENPKQKAAARYRQYCEEGALVITSLLHCATPCMAMGIPVILAKDVVSYRFSWLEALLTIYTPGSYEQIDWAPKPVDYEPHKQKMLNLIIHRVQGVNNREEIDAVHEFYMDRSRCDYVNDAFLPLQRFIDSHWLDAEKPYRYAVWGLTQMAELTVSYISKHYPNAKLCHVYDAKYTSRLGGLHAETPDHIAEHPNETVFVTTVAACSPAKAYFDSLNRPADSYALLSVVV